MAVKMMRATDIRTLLTSLLGEVDFLDIENESHKHRHNPLATLPLETHFKVIVVSPIFHGKTRLQRHQMIYQHLKHLFDAGLHALSLKLYTQEEWAAMSPHSLSSPPCRGGSHGSE